MNISLSKIYVDDDIRRAVIEVLNSGQYIKGENLQSFEGEFANFCGTKYAVGVNSGTSAILLSLIAIGLKEGDEVIVPSHTFIATASPVKFLGATLIYADIDPDIYTIDPADIERRITPKTKAIIPVHLYGHPCDMDAILAIAQQHDLRIIEDACQAHGALYKGRKVGSIGDIGCFSFFPSKNMTVLGEGGMAVTNDETLAERISALRDHGRRQKYIHEMLGLNFRMSEIHAAIGRLQLKHVDEWNAKRRTIADYYNTLLHDLNNVATPAEKEWAKHVYHLYVIRAKQRDELAAHLKRESIATGIHYPVPVHKQPCMESNAYLPITEKYASEVLSLPMHPQLTESEVEYICDKIHGFWR